MSNEQGNFGIEKNERQVKFI